MIWVLAVLQAAAIAISVSIDAFAASFAYGSQKIKVPILSALIINLLCTAIIALSFLIGSALVGLIPDWLASGMAFLILFMIGIIKLFDSITKSIIRKHTQFDKEIKLSVFNFKLVLHLYADPEVADIDISKSLSAKEAVVLAVSLSLDGLAVGLGAAMIGVNLFALIGFTLVIGFVALMLGDWIGNKMANTLRFNISWLAGVILICLAFIQLA